MTTIGQKKRDGKNTMGYAAAGVAGAVAIAGVAVSIALKDKKTRKRVTKALVNAKNQVMDYVAALEVHTQETTPTKRKRSLKGKK